MVGMPVHTRPEVIIQIFLPDSQGAALRFASRPASMTIAEAVKCNHIGDDVIVHAMRDELVDLQVLQRELTPFQAVLEKTECWDEYLIT